MEKIKQTSKQKRHLICHVKHPLTKGGFNPSEKYQLVKLENISPIFGAKIKTYLVYHHPSR